MKELNVMLQDKRTVFLQLMHITHYTSSIADNTILEKGFLIYWQIFFYWGLPDFIRVACQFNLLCDLWLYKHWIQTINKSIFYIIIVDVIFMRIFITDFKKEIVFTKCKTLFKPHLHFVFWPICNQRRLAFHVLSMIVTFHVECNKYSINLL